MNTTDNEIEEKALAIDKGMDEFCESMHTNISETLKLWGDVLIEGCEHGWCKKMKFDDRDIYYAMKMFIAICENKARKEGVEINEVSDEMSVREFIMSHFGFTFDWKPEKQGV